MALNTFSHLPNPLSAHMLKRFQVVMYGSLFYKTLPIMLRSMFARPIECVGGFVKFV